MGGTRFFKMKIPGPETFVVTRFETQSITAPSGGESCGAEFVTISRVDS